MNRPVLIAGFCAAACAAGIALGHLTCRSIVCRDALGIAFGRGHILALTQGQGIYEKDLESEIERLCYANGQDDVDEVEVDAKRAALSRLIGAAAVMHLARNEAVLSTRVDRGLDLVRDQFHDQKTWFGSLGTNHLSIGSLRSEVAAGARAEKWLERQLGNIEITSDECRRYFDAHSQSFFLPERYRASHLFLAAPAETPAPIVDLKRRTIDSSSVRLSHGEDFSDLVRATSEDEASKAREGDLGFFSASRMPADFFSIIKKMEPGITNPPIQTGLGFHIVRVTDRLPARQMAFNEVEAETRLKLENESRVMWAKRLAEKLLGDAAFLRPVL